MTLRRICIARRLKNLLISEKIIWFQKTELLLAENPIKGGNGTILL